MLRTVKPKNARSKRFMQNREAKVHENPKTTLFLRGETASETVRRALQDLRSLRSTNCEYFSKKNPINPFEDEEKIEFFSQKNDASLIVVGTHLKKRPHNMTFIRMFNYEILEMIELGITGSKTLQDFKSVSAQKGLKPLMVFNGELFDTDEHCKQLKNYFLDFFNGEEMDKVTLEGLQHVISFTATPEKKILMRSYAFANRSAGNTASLRRVELEEMGPSFDFEIRRVTSPKADLWKSAMRVPKELKPKKVKNIGVDEMGDMYGRIHVGNQEIHKIQTRKMKGLKRAAGEDDNEGSDTATKKQRED